MNFIISYSDTNFNSLIDIIKKKICVNCQDDFYNKNKKVINLPCGCVLCSNDCFDNYINLLLISRVKFFKEKEIYSEFIFNFCFCGYKFQLKDYFIFNILKKDLNKYIIYALNQNFSLNCFNCLNNINSEETRYYLTLKDKSFELNGINEFKHAICYNCYNNMKNIYHSEIKNLKQINCKICSYFGYQSAIHKISNVKKYKKGEQINDDSCIFF